VVFHNAAILLEQLAVGDLNSGVAQGRANPLTAHAGRARHVLHLSLNKLEERLDPERFVRVHRTHIVNMAHVTAFRRQGRNRLVAELKDGATIPVSRTKAASLRGLGA